MGFSKEQVRALMIKNRREKMNKKKPTDMLQGKFRHFTGDLEVDDDKKEKEENLSPTSRSNVRPFKRPSPSDVNKPTSV